jgi:hypothetical protein
MAAFHVIIQLDDPGAEALSDLGRGGRGVLDDLAEKRSST